MNAYGVYLKPKTKLNNDVEIFARLGYAKGRWKASAPGGSESDSDDGFSYGAGLSYALDPKMSLTADYMQYIKADGAKLSGLTVGVGYRF